ncbi:radical SAM protein [Patescibacteria group bacterium]|nr:radical SAM protein [Patescibacteria group bacterium]MBU2219594.1 radical SAM protein [Patescibacteria group bacterium]MBU2264694.1 radical SAM protein [Patescibacteria group bacterium]
MENKIDKVEIEMTDNLDHLPCLSDVMPHLYQLLDYEIYSSIWLKNFPFCCVSKEAIDHILPKDNKFEWEKNKKCRKCFWFEKCSGFPNGYFDKYGFNEICPAEDLPEEIMIEVTPRCNFNCNFCFNKISFAKKGRKIEEFSTEYVKKIINGIIKSRIKIIRFTGGEPLLRKDIFELLKYAKDRGLETRLNTNGSLIDLKTAKKFKGIVDNVLIPIESWTDAKESEVSGFRNALKKKIKAVKLLKEQEIQVVRAGTVATKENILNFDKIADLIFNLPLDEWELYRPILIDKKTSLSPYLVNLLADKLINLRRKADKPVFIANAIPFCSIKDLNKLNAVSRGALYDDGCRRLVIDPRGFVKPHYFLDENIGDPLNILAAWEHSFMKKMRSLEFLPDACLNCRFKYKCRGGSRYEAKAVNNNYGALDPLAVPQKEI